MADDKMTFKPKHLTLIERLSNIQISRSMGRIVFTATHLADEGDRYLSTIYRIPFDLELRDRDKIRVMTQRGQEDYHPRFAPKGELTFLSTRNHQIPQVYLIHSDGGEAQQITNVPMGVNTFDWLPNGKQMVIISDVYPDLDTQGESYDRDEFRDKIRKEDLELTGYPIRHWNKYMGPKFPHFFLYDVKTETLKDLTPDATIEYIDRHWCISPDGKKIAVSYNEKGDDLSIYTNIALIDLETGERTPVTKEKNIYGNPRFSFDGDKILCEFRPVEYGKVGKRDIVIIDVKTGEIENMTKDLDLWAFEPLWVPYSYNFIFHAEVKGHTQIWKYFVEEKQAKIIVADGHNYGTNVSPDGRNILFIHEESDKPGDLYIKSIKHLDKSYIRMTDFNHDLLNKLSLQKGEFIETKADDGVTIESIVIKPVDFDPNKKYPLLLFIHGGPYVSFRDRFNYRFNHQPYVNRGYIVLKVNARGSTGYGQKFIEQNKGRWGDLHYKDIMAVIKDISKESWVDSDNMAALGTSFGGYMVNWIASQKESAEIFKCFVSFAGMYNLVSFYGTTDLCHKIEHEFDGNPMEKLDDYMKWSPSTYAKNFKTPMLIIHGGRDYRVSYSESLQLYTILERNNVPCKLLFYKDESHWIMKPNNYIHFYETIFNWLEEHFK